MADEEGKLLFGTGIDTTGAQQDADKMGRILTGIGDTASKTGAKVDSSLTGATDKVAKQAGNLQKAFEKAFGEAGLMKASELKESITQQVSYLKQLEQKYKDVSNTVKSLPFSDKKQELEKTLQQQKQEIDEAKAALDGLKEKYKEMSDVSVPSFRKQITELTNQLAEMRMEGQQDTEAYKELEKQLAKLATVQREIQNNRKSDSTGATQITGLLQGLQGLMGAYSAGTGVMSLFIKDQEKLMEIQTKMQSLMSIMIGLQQVANTLHSTSTFRLRTLAKAQELYNAVNLKTVSALKAVGLSANAANVAAKALYGTLTLGISVAVTAAIALWNRYKKAQEEAAEKAKELVEIEQSARSTMIQTQFEIDSTITRIENFNGTREQEKALLSDLQKKYGETFGYFDTLKEYYDVLKEKGNAYIDMLFNQAKAQSLVNKAAEADQKQQELKAKLESPDQSLWDKIKDYIPAAYSSMGAPGVEFGTLIKQIGDKIQDSNIKAMADQYEQFGKMRDEYIDEAKQLQQEIAQTAQDNDLGGHSALNMAGLSEQDMTDALNAVAEYTVKMSKQVEEAELDIRQAQIDGMADGYEKTKAQIDLDYDKLIRANKQREEEWLEELRDMKEKEWEINNPNAKQQGKSFDRSTVTVADLSQKQYDQITAYYDAAEKIRKLKEEQATDALLSEFLTYEQQKLKISQEYEEKRKNLYVLNSKGQIVQNNGEKQLKQGVTQENVDNLEAQYQKTKDALDQEFLSQQQGYEQWCEWVTSLSLENLQALIDSAKAKLQEMQEDESGQYSEEDIGLVSAQIQTLEKQKSKLDPSPGKTANKDWQTLTKTLQNCGREFQQLGNTIGGTTGKIISTVGQVASATLSMMNSLDALSKSTQKGIDSVADMGTDVADTFKQTAEGVGDATKSTATATASAIGTVEKASVILTVISAALQIAMSIVNLFNKDNAKEKEIEELQDRIDELQWELDNSSAVKIQNKLGDALTNVRNIYSQTADEVLRLHLNSMEYANKYIRSIAEEQYQTEILQKSVKKLADQYSSLSYSETKSIGTQKYKDAREELENYAEQLVLIQEQYDLEESKKKTDKDKLADYEQQMAEIADEMNSLIDDLVEDIIGGSSEEIASQLGDAFVEAFQQGEDAAEAWADKVDDIVSDIMKQLLIQQFIEPKIAEIYDKYKAKWFPNGSYAGEDVVKDSMTDFAAELNAAKDEFAEQWEAISDALDLASDSTRDAVSSGIATASQESVDELNGRITVMQSHTYSINETTKSMLVTANLILQSVVDIQADTSVLSSRTADIENYCSKMYSAMEDISLKGVKIRA